MSWVLMSASTCNLLWYAVGEVDEENPVSNIRAGKGRTVLIAFSDNCRYSSIDKNTKTGQR